MAMKKESAAAKVTEVKKTETYKVVGKHFKSKIEANNAIREAHKIGFKGAGLCVRENEFVLLFGTHDTAQIARANLEAIKKAGFEAEIER